MKLERIESPQGITFLVGGSLTGLADSGIRLFEKINHELENGKRDIFLDLEKALFVDSIAVGLIIGVMLKASGTNQCVSMLHVPEQIRKVFDTVNLKKAFPNAY